MISVVLLAVRIYERAPERELDLAKTKSLIKRNIGELKKKVEKKAHAIEEILKKAKATGGRGEAGQDKAKENGGAKNERDSSALAAKKTGKPAISLDPLDEEDRKLTGEVLFGEETTQPAKKQSQDNVTPLLLEQIASQSDAHEPLDLDSIVEIRELYAQELKALDFK